MPAWATWLFGVFLVTGESALLGGLGLETFCFQMALVFTVVVAVRRGFIEGAWILISLSPVVVWATGGPPGLYTGGLFVVFVLIQSVRDWLPRDWGLMHLGLGAGAAVVHASAVAMFAFVVRAEVGIVSAVAWNVPWSVVGVTVGIGPVHWVATRADGALEDSRSIDLFD